MESAFVLLLTIEFWQGRAAVLPLEFRLLWVTVTFL